jgi:hypothetical protein
MRAECAMVALCKQYCRYGKIENRAHIGAARRVVLNYVGLVFVPAFCFLVVR